jgi:predicted metal-dependent hydrolase
MHAARPTRLEPGRPRTATVIQGGRPKTYRPLEPAARASAFEAGLEAYARGDFFEAHELLEPAWMGTDDILERELYQGLIKLAAAFVHVARGNSLGTAKNLRGARARLARVAEERADDHGIDLAGLLADIDAALDALAADAWPIEPPPLIRRESHTGA